MGLIGIPGGAGIGTGCSRSAERAERHQYRCGLLSSLRLALVKPMGAQREHVVDGLHSAAKHHRHIEPEVKFF